MAMAMGNGTCAVCNRIATDLKTRGASAIVTIETPPHGDWVTVYDPEGYGYDLYRFDAETPAEDFSIPASCDFCDRVIFEGYANHHGAAGWFVLCVGCVEANALPAPVETDLF